MVLTSMLLAKELGWKARAFLLESFWDLGALGFQMGRRVHCAEVKRRARRAKGKERKANLAKAKRKAKRKAKARKRARTANSNPNRLQMTSEIRKFSGRLHADVCLPCSLTGQHDSCWAPGFRTRSPLSRALSILIKQRWKSLSNRGWWPSSQEATPWWWADALQVQKTNKDILKGKCNVLTAGEALLSHCQYVTWIQNDQAWRGGRGRTSRIWLWEGPVPLAHTHTDLLRIAVYFCIAVWWVWLWNLI